jgi:hypothetical protein
VDTSLEEPEDEDPGSTTKPSIRERLARHRKSPSCASCHSVIDPLGFALEAYDADGGRRVVDELGNPVDDTGMWPETGEEIRGLSGLRQLLLNDEDQFVRTLTTKLMQYALGRELEYYDRPAIRKVMRDAAPDHYTWSSLVLGIVQSPQFRMRMRAPDTTRQSAFLHQEPGA